MKAAKDLKQVTNYAVMKEYISNNPFEFFKTSFQKTYRKYQTGAELKILQNKIIHSKRLDEVRDCYLFCCYSGYAYTAKELKPQDVRVGFDGDKWIMKDRKKTSNEENVSLPPLAEL